MPPASHEKLRAPTEVTVIIPCLNEAKTVGKCVEIAVASLNSSGITGEVLVADNNSSDYSCQRATAAGGRVIVVPRRG